MALKKTLLEIVQSILDDMDSEEVNSLSDTLEAQQIASVVESVYYSIVATRTVPEHKELIKLTALSDSSYPTHFEYPDNVTSLTRIDYDVSDDGTFSYSEVKWMDPEDFLRLVDKVQSSYASVLDKNAGTNLRIRNDKHPEWYTSFDDRYIVMDSFKSTVDTTLNAGKTRAMGTKFPVFLIQDSYVPDLDADMFPYLMAEAKSTSQSLFKGGSDPKTEQRARRQKVAIQNDRYRSKRNPKWFAYGRRG